MGANVVDTQDSGGGAAAPSGAAGTPDPVEKENPRPGGGGAAGDLLALLVTQQDAIDILVTFREEAAAEIRALQRRVRLLETAATPPASRS